MTIDKIIHKFPAIFKKINFNDIDIENIDPSIDFEKVGER